MNIFVLYNNSSAQSAKELAKTISEAADMNVNYGVYTSSKIKKGLDYIINVGNSLVPTIPTNTLVINHPKQVQVSANKRLARIRFKAKKISAPSLWLTYQEIPEHEFPVVGRTTHHMKAQGFWFCKNRAAAKTAAIKGATHFLKFIKETREFRAHVFSKTFSPSSEEDFIIGRLAEKRTMDKTASTIIKNHDNGYKFLAPLTNDRAVLENVRALAKETLFKFGLHFGGIDIIVSPSKRAYVLEINSSPCLTDENSTTVDVYASHILALMNESTSANKANKHP